MQINIFFGEKFHQNAQKNLKIENFCHNVPNLSETQSPKFPLKKEKENQNFFSPHLDLILIW
jgi:hypothetical protein